MVRSMPLQPENSRRAGYKNLIRIKDAGAEATYIVDSSSNGKSVWKKVSRNLQFYRLPNRFRKQDKSGWRLTIKTIHTHTLPPPSPSSTARCTSVTVFRESSRCWAGSETFTWKSEIKINLVLKLNFDIKSDQGHIHIWLAGSSDWFPFLWLYQSSPQSLKVLSWFIRYALR